MEELNHQLGVKVNKQRLTEVKERYPHGTLSHEIRTLLEHLADGEDYEPDTSGQSPEEIYKNRIHSDEYPDDWNERRQKVMLRDDDQCQNCKTHGGSDGSAELLVHHIVPLDKEGTNHLSNLITLCKWCHDKVHAGY